MSQEIEYTKFETFGVWQENSEKPEEQVVVSFGKSTLLLRDINESIVAQWSFPSISVNTLPDGQVTFSPDEDGIEKLVISDEEMIEQLKKVIQAPIYDRKNFRTIFFLTISLFVTLFLLLNSRNILIGLATSITPNGKASIMFEKLMESKDNPLGRKCIIPEGQKILDQLAEKYKNINDIIILSSTENKFFVLPDGQIILTKKFISDVKDPLEISEFLFLADKANQLNIPLKTFFSSQSILSLLKYISGTSIDWDPKILNELTIQKIEALKEIKSSKIPTQISGLEWVIVQNMCNPI